MPATADIQDQLIDLNTMKFITSALTEASAGRIKKIRDQFERNLEAYQEISRIYHLVRLSSLKTPEAGKVQLPPIEMKILSVAVTSNQRFYGNINTNIMKTFIKNTHEEKSDLLVVGRVGSGFIKAATFGRHFESVIFAADIPTVDEARAFVEKTRDYNQIFVYFPKFVSLVNQTVGITDITQAKTDQQIKEEDVKVLFEPELPKILDFFNRQVRSLLFLRIMLETDLSLTAARIMAMSAAEERSDTLIKEKRVELRRTFSSIVNARLLETFSSIREWENREE